ncbi:MAG TPA: hypothetical protein VKZ59_16400, partial [Acidobacteriota bacterium]|nr:hypothetical protein [Acidobacteriota bacterium]
MSEDTRPVQLAGLRKRVRELQDAAHQLELELKTIESGQAVSLDEGSPPLDLPGINRALQNLASCSTQESILDTFLEEVRQYLDRAVLFLEMDGKYAPWKSLGFVPESIEKVIVDSPEDPVTRAARELRIIYVGERLEELFPWLLDTGYVPQAAVCVPVKLGELVPLVLYADANHSIPIDSLELLTHLTELVVKNHYLSHVAASDKKAARDEEGLADSATMAAASEPFAQAARDFESLLGEEPSAGGDESEVSEPVEPGSLETESIAASEEVAQTESTPRDQFALGQPVEESTPHESDQPVTDFEIREPDEPRAGGAEPGLGEGSFQTGSERDVRALYQSAETSIEDIEAAAVPSDIGEASGSEESSTQLELHEEAISPVAEPPSITESPLASGISSQEDVSSVTEHFPPPEETPQQREEQE